MPTYPELQAQIAALRAQADEARVAEKDEVLNTIRALIIEHQLLPKDLGFHVAAAAQKRGSTAAKYRDPASGATWSGRGRAPRWLEGNRSRFEL